MRSVLGFLGVLLVLIPAGLSLSCKKCGKIGVSTCDGPTSACPPDHVCGAIYSVVSTRGVETTKSYTRECFLQKQCTVEGYMSVIANVKSQIGTSCCDTDGCTPPFPKLPAGNTRPNGLVCRTCVSTNSDWCDTYDTVQCSGDETMCILGTTITTGVESSKFAARGCATKSLCDIGSLSLEINNNKITSTYNCTSGIPDLHNGIPGLCGGFVLSFSVAMLLTKLLS